MSARNFWSSWDKNIDNCLPSINQQKFTYKTKQKFPLRSANHSDVINRNINYNFEVPTYDSSGYERTSSSFSDIFSESETGTPDILSEESDSSAGSALCRSTAEATQALTDEWECIERTIYDEDGKKVTRPQLVEECQQWRQLHPHLRIVGKAVILPEKKLIHRQLEHEEIIAIHYSDYEQFSESEERLSESSTDVTPQNSPRGSLYEEPLLNREKIINYCSQIGEDMLPDSFCSLLHITPINIRSPSLRHRKHSSSILKSEFSSSKWMRNGRPDSSVNSCDRNSAKSFISLDTRNRSCALSATERYKTLNRVLTAKYRDNTKLEPLYSSETIQSDYSKYNNSGNQNVSNRKVSLPPLSLEEDKKKVGSGKKQSSKTKKSKRHWTLSECNARKERNVWN